MDRDVEALHKHLDFIQLTITRMAANSFLLKGWTITIVVAILAFLMKEGRPLAAFTAVLPVVAFWVLDAYYLKQERAYRALYNDAISKDSNVERYSLDASPYMKGEQGVQGAFLSRTLACFYLSTLAVVAMIIWLVPWLFQGS